MLDHLSVTAFSKEGYRLYGRRMLASLRLHTDLPSCVFSEQELPVSALRLQDEPGWREFLDGAPPLPEFPGSYWERWDLNGRRFCHKVFAVTSARLPQSRWRVWIDGDVEFHADMNEDALLDLCPEDCCLSFLGRKDYPWSECGFVAYKVSDPRVVALLADMRKVYTSGELFALPRDRWHDSAVFDLCRHRSGIPVQQQRDLGAGASGREVWEQTLLQRYATHNKGPLRKQRAYGSP